jgi:hypothetical protein
LERRKFFREKTADLTIEAPFLTANLPVLLKKEEKCGGRAPWDQILVVWSYKKQFLKMLTFFIFYTYFFLWDKKPLFSAVRIV